MRIKENTSHHAAMRKGVKSGGDFCQAVISMNRHLPDKAIDVLDEAYSEGKSAGFKSTGQPDKTGTDIAEITWKKKEKIKNGIL